VPALLFLVAAVSVSGLPPLSGFIGKLQLLNSVPEDVIGWVWAAILGSSLMAVIGLSRSGTRLFWRVDPVAEGVEAPPLRRSELAATMLLLGYGVVMTVFAGPILRYTEATAAQLLAPSEMIERVIGETPVLREPSR